MDTLYHYCSAQTFVSLLSSNSLWLSSLSLSNDTLEGRLMYRVFERMAGKNGLGVEAVRALSQEVQPMEQTRDGLGLCLSEREDLLSQWRGYADDGRGFSIGFSRAYLEALGARRLEKGDMSFTLQKVLYLEDEQEALLDSAFRTLQEDLRVATSERTDAERDNDDVSVRESARRTRARIKISTDVLKLSGHLYAMKIEAFKEEVEWRLVHILASRAGQDIHYRSSRDRILPYLIVELEKLDGLAPIDRVRIGPKNITSEQTIRSCLARYGFDGVSVERSSATYR